MVAQRRAIPAVAGRPRRPRQRPERLYGDRAYDSHLHRMLLWIRGIEPLPAQRNTPHGSGLGRCRWVVERTLGWPREFRRLRVRYERRADIHEALLKLGCVIFCWNTLLHGL